MVANSVRRALRLGEAEAVPRVSDLGALVSSTQGKVEIEALEEGREERSSTASCRPRSSLSSGARSRPRISPPSSRPSTKAGRPRRRRPSGVRLLRDARPVAGPSRRPVLALAGSETPGAVASAAELVLEGLHLTKRLNKDAAGAGPRTGAADGAMIWSALVLLALGRLPGRVRGRGRQPCSTRSPTTCSTTATRTRPCGGCSTPASSRPTASGCRDCAT